jgi:hypothetical protein
MIGQCNSKTKLAMKAAFSSLLVTNVADDEMTSGETLERRPSWPLLFQKLIFACSS